MTKRKLLLCLCLALSLLALIQAHHRASAGRSALLKWSDEVAALSSGASIYAPRTSPTGEGFPTPPLTALVLKPFLAPPPVVGAMLWATCKLALAWFIVLTALQLAAGSVRAWPPWAALLVIALAFRPLLSDITHGNVNLLIGATLAAAARSWSRGRVASAGVWAALGAVLKVTPALALALFAWKRSARAVAAFALGVVLFALLVPALWLGWGRNLDLLGQWWAQMIVPYAAGAPPTLMQTEHINQSLLGVISRLCSDAIAIQARPPHFATDVRIHVTSLSPAALRALLLGASALVLGWLACCWPRSRGTPGSAARSQETLGSFALLSLAMLLLSERSWKHHHVLLAFPLAYLAWHLLPHAARRWRVIAGAGLAASALLHGLSGSGVLGERSSDLAEAYGAFLWGDLMLLGACGIVLRGRTRASSARDSESGLASTGLRGRDRSEAEGPASQGTRRATGAVPRPR